MSIVTKFDELHKEAKSNRWLHYFTIFCRVALALGFVPSGIVKVMGERFTALPPNHPLGHYFDALYLTGYYYTFIGVVQLVTALLLLVPRTALLGAMIYFPIIFNICILAYAVRFEGTRITTLMVLAGAYLLVWDYDRLKFILTKQSHENGHSAKKQVLSKKFPLVFFGCVIAVIASVILINHFMFDIRPGNSSLECTNSCVGNEDPDACKIFCDCIYNKGKPLDECLDEYEHAKGERPK
jgi:uncharacterized membrane protein YphA (DoxX/SURF4 family)